MSSESSLRDLHLVFLGAFGWNGDHLHKFSTFQKRGDQDDYKTRYRIAELFTGPKASATRLSTIVRNGITKFCYTYDFGSSWNCVIEIKSVQPFVDAAEKAKYKIALCVKGRQYLGPEDATESEEESFDDSARFDVAQANKRIQRFMSGRGNELAYMCADQSVESYLTQDPDAPCLSREDLEARRAMVTVMPGVLQQRDRNVAPKRNAVDIMYDLVQAHAASENKKADTQASKRSRAV